MEQPVFHVNWKQYDAICRRRAFRFRMAIQETEKDFNMTGSNGDNAENVDYSKDIRDIVERIVTMAAEKTAVSTATLGKTPAKSKSASKVQKNLVQKRTRNKDGKFIKKCQNE